MQDQDPTRIDLNVEESLNDPTVRRWIGIAYHGNTPFDVPFISNIDGNLWQGGCQDGLVLPASFKHVISLYPWEEYTLKHKLKSNLSIVMYDSLNQATGQVDALAHWVNSCVQDGPTLVHCQAGLNRSSLIAARSLMLRVANPLTADEAIAMLRTKRSQACLCNPAFEEHLRRL